MSPWLYNYFINSKIPASLFLSYIMRVWLSPQWPSNDLTIYSSPYNIYKIFFFVFFFFIDRYGNNNNNSRPYTSDESRINTKLMMLRRCYCRFFSPVLKTLYIHIYDIFFSFISRKPRWMKPPQHDSTHGFLHSRTPLKYIQCNNDNNTCEPYNNIKVVLPAVNKSLWCTIYRLLKAHIIILAIRICSLWNSIIIIIISLLFWLQKDTSSSAGPLIGLLSTVCTLDFRSNADLPIIIIIIWYNMQVNTHNCDFRRSYKIYENTISFETVVWVPILYTTLLLYTDDFVRTI